MRRVLVLIACFTYLPWAFSDASGRKAELRNHKKALEDYLKAAEYVRIGNIEKAKLLLDEALKLDPTNVPAVTARELLRQRDVQQKISDADQKIASDQRDSAIAELRDALKLDPRNALLQERLRTALEPISGPRLGRTQIQYRDADEIQIQPAASRQDFHYRGDTRGLLERLWNAYSVRPVIDSSVTSRQLRFDLEGADFAIATTIAGQMTKTFYVPLSKTQALIVGDTPENRKNFERLSLRTFYVGDATTPQEINDVVTVLKTIFDMRFVSPNANTNQVTVRAPLPLLDAATRILEDIYSGKPQVMLEVNIFQIEQTLARDLGIGLPNQFTLFNVNTEAQQLLNNANPDLINQLISSGAINQANSAGIAALLAGLAAGGQNSILNQPIATFGGGITKSGVIIPGVTFHASLNKGSFQSLDHVMLRVAQNDAATYRNGTRYPILNASFAPIFNTPAISQVISNQSFIAPFPSFNYEDLGLTLKATPTIHGSQYVSLKLEFQLRDLGSTQLNGVPVITNREYSGTISVPTGETAVLAGMVSKSEQISLSGVLGLSQLPLFGPGLSVHNKQTDDAELLVTIRPELIRDSVHQPNAGTAFVPLPGSQ